MVNGSLQELSAPEWREYNEIYFNELRFQLELKSQKADPALAAAVSVSIVLAIAMAGIVFIKTCRNKLKQR